MMGLSRNGLEVRPLFDENNGLSEFSDPYLTLTGFPGIFLKKVNRRFLANKKMPPTSLKQGASLKPGILYFRYVYMCAYLLIQVKPAKKE